MTPSLPLRAALLSALILGVAACHRQAPPPEVQAAPPDAQTTPAAPVDAAPEKPDKQGVTFGEGFHKEEAGPVVTLRWVRRDAALHVNAPSEGRYQLTFRPFTVFSTVENSVALSVNDQPAGSFSFKIFDLSHPTPTTLDATLHAGDNTLRLHSQGSENRMSDTDDRVVAYGLAMPVTVERAP